MIRDDLVAAYSTDRYEAFKASKLDTMLDMIEVKLTAGPWDGWTKEFDLLPDFFEAKGGKYIPLLVLPWQYMWVPDNRAETTPEEGF